MYVLQEEVGAFFVKLVINGCWCVFLMKLRLMSYQTGKVTNAKDFVSFLVFETAWEGGNERCPGLYSFPIFPLFQKPFPD